MNFSEKLIANYQKDANRTLAKVCRWIALLMFSIGFLNFLGVFIIKSEYMYITIGLSIVVAILPTIVFDVIKIDKAWAQYLVLTALVCMSGIMYAVVTYHAVIMLVFPVVCASLYSERKWIIYTMLISAPMLIISHLVAFQLKVVPDEPLVTIHGVVFFGILPRLIQFLAIGVISISITTRIRKLIEALVNSNNELYENQQNLVESLSELVEAQSQEPGQHVKRVSEYTRILCEKMGMNPEETWKVSMASMMHDVGKLVVPAQIIEKPGKLTEEEFEQVKRHVDFGKRMLEKSPGEVMQIASAIAYEHHERWDGNGYKKIKGEEINRYARCVAIADVFDALVSWRPYKKPWTAKEAYDEIVSKSGTQFDPELIKLFKESFTEFEEVMRLYPESREAVENQGVIAE